MRAPEPWTATLTDTRAALERAVKKVRAARRAIDDLGDDLGRANQAIREEKARRVRETTNE